ncbi:UDP-N-acetylmuramate dehydrogenase [Aerococcus christensenii]|uniref:UDP-N-acetylenolpyruvoylglucosamine reductase n=1 Tax=Aerococcus christensenii TaxID=87541 RepID=A0A133Y2M6_9LACT|nr:UDP-N-acetylmuramate dehydrogenase [Aerococcus christensenii]KXB37454.1 UDP-N-acetylmuramate dehydrogenase [Aerococcus christensenii]
MTIKAFMDRFDPKHIKPNEPLKYYAYTKTGGPADVLAFPHTIDELQEMIRVANQLDLPFMTLGNSSNVIVSDKGIEGIVFMLRELNRVKVQGHLLSAEAGAKLVDVSRAACEAKLTGLEFACGIPGSVGGAIYMNAGAYGGEIKDLPLEVTVVTREGNLKTYTNEELEFSYRHSLVQENGDSVVRASFTLEEGQQATIRGKMEELNALRQSKQPLDLPSCGSVFKRPKGHYTGQLIQEAGLQGFTIGGAQVSTKHAGFIVNINDATAADYLAVIHHVQSVIKEKYNVDLETEVRIIGRPMA